jgi:hypothetical protein
MEQRRLRLGDIVDDYCPRERRVTNHAVVAMIEEEIKQTRCTTCDAEHPYKGGHAPKRRKKESSSSALYNEVLAGKGDEAPHLTRTPEADETPAQADEEFRAEPVSPPQLPVVPPSVAEGVGPNVPLAAIAGDEADRDDADRSDIDRSEGPVHRQLIRATLPRPEGQKEVRNPPDFTIRQAGGRGNAGNQQFRGGGNARARLRGGGQSNGHRSPGGHGRFAGARPGQGGQPRGQGGNFRAPQQPRHGGGNRKRSR